MYKEKRLAFKLSVQKKIMQKVQTYCHKKSSAYDNEAKENVVIKKLIRAFENEVTAKHAYREYSILKFVNHCNVSFFV